MKRSEINAALREMEAMVQKCGFQLPPFCSFTPEEWQKKGHEYDEIRPARDRFQPDAAAARKQV